MKTGLVNCFVIHRAFPTRTLGCLLEGNQLRCLKCLQLGLRGPPGYSRVLVNGEGSLFEVVQMSALIVSHSALWWDSRVMTSDPDHTLGQLSSHPRYQGRFVMVLLLVSRHFLVPCMGFLVTILLRVACIRCSSCRHGIRHVLTEATTTQYG